MATGTQKHRNSKHSSEEDITAKFREGGQTFKAKLYGKIPVTDSKSDELVQAALHQFKLSMKGSKEHKKKILVRVTLEGVSLEDLTTKDVLAHHPVRQIAYLSRDKIDTRGFAYIVNNGSGSSSPYSLFGVKTEGKAETVLLAIKAMFDAVYKLEHDPKLRTSSLSGSVRSDQSSSSHPAQAANQASPSAPPSYTAISNPPQVQQVNQYADEEAAVAAAILESLDLEQKRQARLALQAEQDRRLFISSPAEPSLVEATAPTPDDDRPAPYLNIPPETGEVKVINVMEPSNDTPVPSAAEPDSSSGLVVSVAEPTILMAPAESVVGEDTGDERLAATQDERSVVAEEIPDNTESETTAVESEPTVPTVSLSAGFNAAWPNQSQTAWNDVEWPADAATTDSNPWGDLAAAKEAQVEAGWAVNFTADDAWSSPPAIDKPENSKSLFEPQFDPPDISQPGHMASFQQSTEMNNEINVNAPSNSVSNTAPSEHRPTASKPATDSVFGPEKDEKSFDPFAEQDDSHDPWSQSGGFELEDIPETTDKFQDNPFEINLGKRHKKTDSVGSNSSSHHQRVSLSRASNRSVSPFESDPFFTALSPALLRKQASIPEVKFEAKNEVTANVNYGMEDPENKRENKPHEAAVLSYNGKENHSSSRNAEAKSDVGPGERDPSHSKPAGPDVGGKLQNSEQCAEKTEAGAAFGDAFFDTSFPEGSELQVGFASNLDNSFSNVEDPFISQDDGISDSVWQSTEPVKNTEQASAHLPFDQLEPKFDGFNPKTVFLDDNEGACDEPLAVEKPQENDALKESTTTVPAMLGQPIETVEPKPLFISGATTESEVTTENDFNEQPVHRTTDAVNVTHIQSHYSLEEDHAVSVVSQPNALELMDASLNFGEFSEVLGKKTTEYPPTSFEIEERQTSSPNESEGHEKLNLSESEPTITPLNLNEQTKGLTGSLENLLKSPPPQLPAPKLPPEISVVIPENIGINIQPCAPPPIPSRPLSTKSTNFDISGPPSCAPPSLPKTDTTSNARAPPPIPKRQSDSPLHTAPRMPTRPTSQSSQMASQDGQPPQIPLRPGEKS